MRLLRRANETTRGAPALWTTTVVGRGNQTFFAGGREGLVYLGDGDGVMYTNLRFRAYSLVDGREIASVRTGTTVRCLTTFPDGDLLVATDHRLHRLDPTMLIERQRWERGIPDFGDSIVLDRDIAAVAMWRGPSVTMVDLGDGSVRRKRWVDRPRLVPAPSAPLLIAGGDGEVSRLDLQGAERTAVFRTRGVRDAVVHRGVLWSIEGRPKYGVGDDGENKSVVAHDLEAGVEAHRVRLPSGANRLAADGETLWAFGWGSIVEIALTESIRVVGRWTAPPAHRWSAVDPVRRLGFSTTTDVLEPMTMTCHALGRV